MAHPPIVAFLSTGRCGTQWFTAGLRELHPEVEAEHEPLGPLYMPRRFFRRYTDPDAQLQVPDIARHLERIETLRRPYAETGWPLFSALPLLARRFPKRLRIVHLTRHPVPTALSHLAHQSYAGSPRADAYTRWATLGPRDPGVFQPHYAHSWHRLSSYEKCLFWWTEVHLFALELPRRIEGIPFIRVRAEKLLAADRAELESLLDFMTLPWREGWIPHAHRVVDRWHHHTDETINPMEIRRHPGTVAASTQLGYDVEHVDISALDSRYHGAPDAGQDRIGRWQS